MVSFSKARRCGRFNFKTMKFMLGTKARMTQVFDDKGVVSAATMIVAGPLVATQVKTKEKDGYVATQFGFGTKKEKNLGKPLQGHLKDLAPARYIREFATEGVER